MLLSVLETPNGKDKRVNRMTGVPKLKLSKIGVTHVIEEKTCGPKENGHTFRGQMWHFHVTHIAISA